MRKGLKETMSGTTAFSQHTLDELERTGYHFLQIKGFTIDRHFDYTEPYYILLVPIKALPEEQADKDIYEPINSNIFQKWINENNEFPKILIALVRK